MKNDLNKQPVIDELAVVENSKPAQNQNPETENIIIYDECGDTLWDEVLAQDELKK